MSEQSSVVVMFRGLVMLVCLIAIPLAALFGSSLPALVKAVHEGRLPTLAELRGASVAAENTLSEAPRFVPTPSAAPVATSAGPPVPSSPANGPSQGAWPGQGTEASAVFPARYDAPLDSAPAAPRGLRPLGAADANLVPIGPGGERPASAQGNPAPPATPGGGLAAATFSAGNHSDPYTLLQDRLQKLGATYYLLESWGDQERQYRFYCEMAIGGNTRYKRSFWSIDTDPVRAMAQVLEQVQAWQVGRP